MMTFSGMEYLAIDIANQFGMDKCSWKERIAWVRDNIDCLENKIDQADDRFMYIKAVKTLRKAQQGKATGFIMGLDATASGYQIMACLSGCKKTAAAVNLMPGYPRRDIYEYVAIKMNADHGTKVDRDIVKKPIMTVAYGSKAQPEAIFGKGTPELAAFYKILNTELSGAMDVMELIREAWRPDVFEQSFTMPDGHVVILPVTEMQDYKIDADELGHTFTYRMEVNVHSGNGTSLIANVIHAVDGYIAREMVRRANKLGIELAHIHDSFWASPQYMNTVRFNYVEILAEIAKSDLLQNILRQITGDNSIEIEKDSDDLYKDIRKSDYALS